MKPLGKSRRRIVTDVSTYSTPLRARLSVDVRGIRRAICTTRYPILSFRPKWRIRRAGTPPDGLHCPFGKRASVSGERESNLLPFPIVARDYTFWVYIVTNRNQFCSLHRCDQFLVAQNLAAPRRDWCRLSCCIPLHQIDLLRALSGCSRRDCARNSAQEMVTREEG